MLNQSINVNYIAPFGKEKNILPDWRTLLEWRATWKAEVSGKLLLDPLKTPRSRVGCGQILPAWSASPGVRWAGWSAAAPGRGHSHGASSPTGEKQGKSEGFESCDRPIVRKRPIWVKIGDVLSRVTFKFDECPWKTIGHLFFAVSSFVQHFIAIGEFTLELQSGNAQFESNSTIFRAMWPWNLTDDLEK